MKGLTAAFLKAEAEQARSQKAKSDNSDKEMWLMRLREKFVDDTISKLENIAINVAELGGMVIKLVFPDSVYDESTDKNFVVDISHDVATYFRDKGFNVAFESHIEKLDDGIGGTMVPVKKIVLSWAP